MNRQFFVNHDDTVAQKVRLVYLFLVFSTKFCVTVVEFISICSFHLSFCRLWFIKPVLGGPISDVLGPVRG